MATQQRAAARIAGQNTSGCRCSCERGASSIRFVTVRYCFGAGQVNPDQQLNSLLLLGSVGVAFAFDLVAWRAWPRLALWAAWMPLTTRRLQVGTAALAALAQPDLAATYRTPGAAGIDWTRLPGPLAFRAGDARVEIDAPNALVLLQLPFQGRWFAFCGVVAMRLELVGASLVVGARVLPFLSASSLGLVGAIALLVLLTGGPWGVAVFMLATLMLFNAVGGFRTRKLALPFAAAVVDEIERRITQAAGEG